MKLKTLTAAALIVVSGAFATSAAAGGLTDTKVKIKGQNGDYYGYVKSHDAEHCADDRKVKVYKMLGSSPKPKHDLKIGTDHTSPSGSKYMWSIGNSGYKDGYFYAKVNKTPYCAADYSKVISR